MVAKPASCAAFRLAGCFPERSMKRLLKSTPPKRRPTGGKMMSLTSELTTAARATPKINARAKARTFALRRNCLNSDIMARNLHPYAAPCAARRLRRDAPPQGISTLSARDTGELASVTSLTTTVGGWYALGTLDRRVLIDEETQFR